MKRVLILFVLVFICVNFSCTAYKNILYLEDLDKSKPFKESIQNYSPITIQPDDLLSINISSLNAEASAVFKTASIGSSSGLDAGEIGLLVDKSGKIQLPKIGIVQASGLTTQELKNLLLNKLSPYLSDPIVNVRISNFKITVLGDVHSPGIYDIPGEKVSIPQVLSMAGDLNSTAKREQAILIREESGSREYIPLDLTRKDLFRDSYYYLKNNDIIYIQPRRTKSGGLDRSFQIIGLVLSIVSVGAIVLMR